MTEETNKACLFCERNENEIPLVQIHYQEKDLWICPQHIPVLIHDPSKCHFWFEIKNESLSVLKPTGLPSTLMKINYHYDLLFSIFMPYK